MKNVIYICPACNFRTENTSILVPRKGGCSSCGKSNYKCSRCGSPMKMSQTPKNNSPFMHERIETAVKPQRVLYENSTVRRDLKINRH